jgi:hypothetical protein
MRKRLLVTMLLALGAAGASCHPLTAPNIDGGGSGGGVQQCGTTTCGEGTVCCNASCGICTPPGGGCAGIVCGPPKYHYTCGQRICNPNDPRVDAGRPSTTNPPCTNDQKEGASCSSFDMICDPSDVCDRMLACQTSPSICPF